MLVAFNPIDALPISAVESLFDNVPNAIFAVKDRSLRYVAASHALADLCGMRSRFELLQKGDTDIFAHPSGASFSASDRIVMRTGYPLLDKLESLVFPGRKTLWALTSRWPWEGKSNHQTGVVVLMRLLSNPRQEPQLSRLARAGAIMKQNIGQQLDMPTLADSLDISVTRLAHDFRNVFGVPPFRYFTKLRLESAIERLATTDQLIADIAHQCGYADQSAFTRRFQAVMGSTPGQYRRSLGHPNSLDLRAS